MKKIFFFIIELFFSFVVFAEPELVVQEWHNGSTKYVEYSRDGKYILTANSNDIKIWDSNTGLLIRGINDLHYSRFVKFSPDCKHIMFENDAVIQRLDIISGYESNLYRLVNGQKYEFELEGFRLSFSKDGSYFAVVDGRKVFIYDVDSSRKCFELPDFSFDKWISDIYISDNSRYVAVSSSNKCVVWDIKTKQTALTMTCNADITSLDIDSSEEYIACGTKVGFIVRRIQTNEVLLNAKYDRNDDVEAKFIPNSQKILSIQDAKKYVLCWDFITRDKVTIAETSSWSGYHATITFNSNANEFAVITDDSVDIVNYDTGKVVTKTKLLSTASNLVYNPKNDSMYIYSWKENNFIHMNSNFIEEEAFPDMDKINFSAFTLFDDGVLYINKVNNVLTKYDEVKNKTEEIMSVRKIPSHVTYLSAATNGSIVAYTDGDLNLHICDTQKKSIFTIYNNIDNMDEWPDVGPDAFQVSPDGKYVVFLNGKNGKVHNIIDTRKNKIVKKLSSNVSFCGNGRFSYDGKFYAVKNENNIVIYETSSWKEKFNLGDGGDFCFSYDGKYIAVRTYDGGEGLNLYSFPSMKLERRFAVNCRNFCFNKDLSKIISIDFGGKICCYSTENGNCLVNALADTAGDYIVYTPEGYFRATENGINKFAHLVDGMQVSELGQYAEFLYRPDLVAAKLRGEDISKSESFVSLSDIISTGEAPVVQFTQNPSTSTNRDITVNFSVQDMGGGIGSVYLKLNNKVIQLADGSRKFELVGGEVDTSQKNNGKTTQFSHLITLQNGENTIEAYATNAAGKIESSHAVTKISWQGSTAKPNLYVLAVGVNQYRDRSLWLNYAVPDATSIADQFRSVKGNLYQSVNVTTVLDGEVTSSGIATAFNSLANKVSADDVFIFYLSGHGTTHTDGDYYFIPVDFRFRNAESIPESAISKHYITEQLSKIKAQKTLVMLDTCNSGAFISTGARGMAEKTAIDRLSRATGQATIAASSDTQSAMEGYEGHGIFTYVILEGLSGKADINSDGYVSLSELSSYAEDKVPDYSYAKWGYEQYPQVDLRKQSNFPLVGK